VFENRVLRRIFGPKRDEVPGKWGDNYIMISLMICTPHHLGDPGVDGSIILRWIYRKWGSGLDRAGSG
jgi:hypothetical protein